MAKRLQHLANWLIERGHIKSEECPIRISQWAQSRYFIHTKPQHPSGRDFFLPKQLSNGLYLEAHSSQKQNITYARLLLERYDYPPSTLQLIGFDD